MIKKLIAILMLVCMTLTPAGVMAKPTNYTNNWDGTVTADLIKQVQTALNSKGYDVGTADGIIGQRTNSAIEQYKRDNGLTVNTDIDEDLLANLNINPEELTEVATPSTDTAAAESVGVPIDTFVARYNEAAAYYNSIADRDGYFHMQTITASGLKNENYDPDYGMGFEITVNEDSNDYSKIHSWETNAMMDSLTDNNILTGEIMACIYALDVSLTNCSQALDLWDQLAHSDYFTYNSIQYMNVSFTGFVSFSGKIK